jgi:hypothetical protein
VGGHARVNEKDIEIKLKGGLLIKGKVGTDIYAGLRPTQHEYNVRNYYREFALDEDVDDSKIKGTLRRQTAYRWLRLARTLATGRILNHFVLSRRLTRSSAISDRGRVCDLNPQQTGTLCLQRQPSWILLASVNITILCFCFCFVFCFVQH